jgi:hypothetical protein
MLAAAAAWRKRCVLLTCIAQLVGHFASLAGTHFNLHLLTYSSSKIHVQAPQGEHTCSATLTMLLTMSIFRV